MPTLEARALTPVNARGDSAAAFAQALHDAIALLRVLPRAPRDTPDARERLRGFAAAHPATSPEFLIDLAPGAEHADFDIYLAHPEGGTVAVTFREDAGRPWYVDYSEHWASNYVLLVGTMRVTVQEALFAIQYLSEREPNLVGSLVRDSLLAEAAASNPEEWAGSMLEVSAQEVQDAADAFRHAHQLESAADTHAWLERMGWSTHRFKSVLASGVRLRKMEERLVAGRVETYFDAHRADFELVHLFRVECDDAETAALLVKAAADVGLMTALQRLMSERPGGPPIPRIDGALTAARAHTLDDGVRAAEPGAIVGPAEVRGRHVVAQMLAREPAATLDAATRRAVRERLVQDWLAVRAREVPVQWNWT